LAKPTEVAVVVSVDVAVVTWVVVGVVSAVVVAVVVTVEVTVEVAVLTQVSHIAGQDTRKLSAMAPTVPALQKFASVAMHDG